MLKCLSHEKESLIPTKLINDLRSGNVVALVGAGISMGVGFPSWGELIKSIADNISQTGWGYTELQNWTEKNANTNPEWVAEVLSSANSKAYYDAIKSEFDLNRKHETLTHALLSLLPFKGYITTNYDTLIEHNLRLFTDYEPTIFNQENAIDLLTKHTDKKFIYKVHGDINSSYENIILSETDYYALQKNQIYTKVLSWLLSQNTLVSFGYSLRDRDFRSILNERYELFKGNCPPFYVFTSSKDTCKEEIDCYRSKFNVHIVSISPEYNFMELTSTLLSMYCLCHRIESQHNSQDIVNLINVRISKQPYQLGFISNDDTIKAHRILSVLKDPLEISEIVSMLSESDVNITSAHIELLCKQVDSQKVICNDRFDEKNDRIVIAKFLKKNIDVIPIDDNPKFLSSYYKHIIDKYHKTLSYLLSKEESFKILITTTNELKRIVEYYKQQGLWQEWLLIAQKAQHFCVDSLNISILQSIAWIYFWTRDYVSLQEIIAVNPHIDSEKGVNDYTSKLYYMTVDGLNKLAQELELKYNENNITYFDISLLGRVYARLSTKHEDKKMEYLNKAELFIKDALQQAVDSKDMIEISVQNWYLSLILIDKGNIEEAKSHLAETKRLDENIMERKPGIAWLRVAEYRLALKNNHTRALIAKRNAYNAMNELGMKNINDYLDNEYYF